MKIPFFSFLLIFQFNLICMELPDAVFSKQPAWDDALNFEEIENYLVNVPIQKLIEMRKFLQSQGKTASYSTEVYLAILENGLKAVFKPEDLLRNTYGEIAAYKFSEWLGLRLVPPTVFAEHQGRRGSLQFYVDSPYDLFRPKQCGIATSLLTEKQLSDMYLFYFVIGQWDSHNGNRIITSKGKLALIDNAAIRHRIRVQYGDHAFIRITPDCEPHVVPLSNKAFPFEQVKCMSFPIDVDITKLGIPAGLISEKNVKSWNSSNMKCLNYVVWENSLWVQFHKHDKNVKPNFSQVCYASTLKKIESLNFEILCSIFKEAIDGDIDDFDDELLNDILERCNQLLASTKKIINDIANL